MCRYLSLFLLYINIKIGKNRYQLLDWSVTIGMGNSQVHLDVAGDAFDGAFLCCPFPHEMSWIGTGTSLSQFQRVFLPTLARLCFELYPGL